MLAEQRAEFQGPSVPLGDDDHVGSVAEWPRPCGPIFRCPPALFGGVESLRPVRRKAIFENDRATPTGLSGNMRERGFSRVFVAELALDFLRTLLGGRRDARGLFGPRDRGFLPRHRC